MIINNGFKTKDFFRFFFLNKGLVYNGYSPPPFPQKSRRVQKPKQGGMMGRSGDATFTVP